MILTLIFAFYLCSPLSASTTKSTTKIPCGELGDCLLTTADCQEKCGCDKIFVFNETLNECVLDMEYFRQEVTEKYNTQEDLRLESEKVFNGIIISCILFIICASLCGLTACIYCFHIHYSDFRLRKDVKALSQKLNRDGKLKKPPKTRVQPKAESCNVIVEDAGVFVC